MKLKNLWIGLCLLTAHPLFAQQSTKDSTTLTINHGSKIPEVMELFKFQGINYFKITSKDAHIGDYYFQFVIKEYDGEKLIHCDTLMNAAERSAYDNRKDVDTAFSVMVQATQRDSVNFSFNLGRAGLKRRYKKMPVNTYSLRDAISSHGSPVKVPIGKAFPLLVYSLPYEDPARPGYLFYCALTADGTPPEQWGQKFGVKHLIILELSILKK